MIPSRANVERVGSDQSELASKCKLQVAFGQCPLGLLVVRDVTRNPEQLTGPAIGIVHDGAFERYPALVAEIRATDSRSETVFDLAAATSTLGSSEGGVQCW